MMLELNKIHLMNCVDGLQLMEPKSVHTCITSPPYYALRDYGLEPTLWPAITYSLFGNKIKIKAQKACLGLEKDIFSFIGHLVYVYRLVRECLRDDGTIWVNMGDSYAANQKKRTNEQACRKSNLNGGKASQIACKDQIKKSGNKIKPKDMLGIPWMLAFALRDDGWYLRQDEIWHKTNCMPESCNDRCTKNHEYIFLLSKKNKYYFDAVAIAEPVAESTRNDARLYNQDFTDKRPDRDFTGNRPDRGSSLLKPMRTPRVGIDTRGGNQGAGDIPPVSKSGNFRRDNHHSELIPGQSAVQHRADRKESIPSALANKRSVWSLSTQGFPEAHFATFPKKLVAIPVLAGTSAYGCCAACGAPYRRLTKKELVPGPKASFNSQPDNRDAESDGNDAGSNRMSDGHKPGWVNRVCEKGWMKTCSCVTDTIKPCVVLDMFMGSGTTAIVSKELLRDFIGFEQSAKYLKIAKKRMHKELGLFTGAVTELRKEESAA